MFKNFDKSSIGTISPLKTSIIVKIKTQLIEQYPKLSEIIEEYFSKKSTIYTANCKDQIQMLFDEQKKVLFFREREGPYMPSLHFACKYHKHFPCIRVDKGAISFVLSGSDIMDRGITSEGGHIPVELEELSAGSCVIILAEDKMNPLAVGLLLKTPAEIKSENSGKGIQNVHYLSDFLWNYNK